MSEDKDKKDMNIEKAWNFTQEQKAKSEDQVRKEARAIIAKDGYKDGVMDASPEENEKQIIKCLNKYHKKHPDDLHTPTLLKWIKIDGIGYEALAMFYKRQGHPFITPNIVREKEKIALKRVMEALV